MNTKIKTFVLIAIFTLGFTTLSAQSKIAHINTEELVASMPETKALQSKLEKLSKTYEAEVKLKEAELEAKFTRYNSEFESQTEAANAERTKEVQEDAKKIEQFKTEAIRDIQKQEQEGLKPILEKARNAIDEVATEQGFEYVLNASSLVVAKGKNLLGDVKAKLEVQ